MSLCLADALSPLCVTESWGPQGDCSGAFVFLSHDLLFSGPRLSALSSCFRPIWVTLHYSHVSPPPFSLVSSFYLLSTLPLLCSNGTVSAGPFFFLVFPLTPHPNPMGAGSAQCPSRSPLASESPPSMQAQPPWDSPPALPSSSRLWRTPLWLYDSGFQLSFGLIRM